MSKICLRKPTPEEQQLTEQLHQELQTQQIFETPEEQENRTDLLQKLETIFVNWVKRLAKCRGVPEEKLDNVGGQVREFGSFRLEAHLRDADIDALCVAPKYIERWEFFTSLYWVLKSQPEVTAIYAIERAMTPLIRLTFSGVEVDLLFAQIPRSKIPEDIDLREMFLCKDKRCERSLYGCRVTYAIESSIHDYESFKLALRTIKLWAKKNGIYSKILGFLGGLAWSVLVAYICELHPAAVASEIVRQFFLVFSQWQWPKPVYLMYVARYRRWIKNPYIDPAFLKHMMPIITPAYPAQSCARGVTSSAKKIIEDELKRGHKTMCEIVNGSASWNRLFESENFFSKYEHFAVLLVGSETIDDHPKWCGFVLSNILRLDQYMQVEKQIDLTHIYTKDFQRKPLDNTTATAEILRYYKPAFCTMWFVGFEVNSQSEVGTNISFNMRKFCACIKELGYRRAMYKDELTIRGIYVPKNELHQYLDADFLPKAEAT